MNSRHKIKINFGVIKFLGSNCLDDVTNFVKTNLNGNVKEFLWFEDDNNLFNDIDIIIIPGGFSYSDTLRPGCIAAKSKICRHIKAFANSNGIVIGICNGFQILTEMKLLEGVLIKNKNRKFICKNINIISQYKNQITKYIKKKPITLPIAHLMGRYYCNDSVLEKLKMNNQIVFQYCSHNGEVLDLYNINGSTDNIAGVSNENHNVIGLMPHPERIFYKNKKETINDGTLIFESVINFLKLRSSKDL